MIETECNHNFYELISYKCDFITSTCNKNYFILSRFTWINDLMPINELIQIGMNHSVRIQIDLCNQWGENNANFITMTKFWFYICTLVLVLYMFLIVGHAKILHVSVLSHCCNVEKTRATYRHEESMKKLLRECDRELGKIFYYFHFIILVSTFSCFIQTIQKSPIPE